MTTASKNVQINCDMGESFGLWQMGADKAIMPLIDMANIACGFHAGDPAVMQATIMSALEHNVKIGAHPGYPDLQGFGRRSMKFAKEELRAMLCYQVGALEGLTRACGGQLHHVKPHGAMYNDMMQDQALLLEIIQAVSDYNEDLTLVIQATQDWAEHETLAAKYGVTLMFEGFSDRGYQNNGLLVPRNSSGALLSSEDALAQSQLMLQQGQVKSIEGACLALKIDTLCIHGDGVNALPIAKSLSEFNRQ